MTVTTIPGVEIARVGRYDLSSGPHTFTREQLASAARAPGPAPRIGIGHTDSRFDGTPSFGRVENMRLAENGDTLLGDLVDVPDWLAEAMPSAYPGRSIEAAADESSMRITALKLLGQTLPGITSLSDLRSTLAGRPVMVAAGADRTGSNYTVVLPTVVPDGRTQHLIAAATAQARRDSELEYLRSMSPNAAAVWEAGR